jgi:hypothetical protein
VLHPQHKLEYFKNAGWEQAWIEEAEAIVRAEFERSYKYAEHLQPLPKPTEVRYFSILTTLKLTSVTAHSFNRIISGRKHLRQSTRTSNAHDSQAEG